MLDPRALLSGLAGAVQRPLAALVPQGRPGDLDERDPDVMRELLPGMWLLISAWYRPEIRGIERMPRTGPLLVVGNHSGGLNSPEVFISQLAFSTYFGVERAHYQLAHRLVLASPLGALLRRFGTVEADPDNARKALAEGAMVTVFPGGDQEVFRPSWRSAEVDFAGRKGFLRLALEQRAPIVPMVAVGGQETALFLSNGEWLAKALRLDKAFRLKALPIVVGPPFGVSIGGLLPVLPLPVKVTIELLDPIDLRERYGEDPDVDAIYDDLTGLMQDKLTELQAERRLPVLG